MATTSAKRAELRRLALADEFPFPASTVIDVLDDLEAAEAELEHQAKVSKTLHDVVRFLNELNKLDPEWTADLVRHRWPANEEIAEHPSVQVLSKPWRGEKANEPLTYRFEAGLLGFLNGLYGANEESGYISVVWHGSAVETFLITEDAGAVTVLGGGSVNSV